MKKTFFFLIAILFAIVAKAQTTDFSGSWKLNTAESTLNQEFTMAPAEMNIEQKGNDIKIEKLSSFQGENFTTIDKLTLDGKESVNTGFMDSQKKSTTNWSDDKKSINVNSKIVFDGGEITLTENYKMNGKKLVIDSGSTSSFGDSKETFVFDKK